MRMNKVTNRRTWTDEEIELVIELYDIFYTHQIKGEKYQKAQPVRDMAELLGRSKSSIECLLMNISSIRQDIYHFDIVTGYKPLPNYSKNLLNVFSTPYREVTDMLNRKVA